MLFNLAVLFWFNPDWSGGTGSTTLSVADVSDADGGSYSVIVSNALMSVTSAVAVLTLNDAAQLGQW